jgi:amino acid adenylation domain-containing protein
MHGRAREGAGGSQSAIPDSLETIQQLFALQVARHSAAHAIVDGERSISYAELDAYSEQLADRLVSLGLQREERVGICLERSPELLIALLAVVKAGAAYLPFDAAYPPERIRFMLDDGGVRVLITTRRDAHHGDELVHTLCMDELELVLAPASDEPQHDASGERELPLPRVDPLARLESKHALDRASAASSADESPLAYVCYTSGSTGTPKGVAVTHAGVLRLVHEVRYVALGPAAVVLHAAPPAFDATTFEVWGPLLTGGCCAILREPIPSASALASATARHGVTTAFLTTALVNAVVDEQPTALAGLSQLLFGGEAVSVRHIARLQAACPRLSLVHVYGPTETTTFATAFPIVEPIDPSAPTIPIGRAIEGTSVHVLDDRLSPVPVGDAGELYIGGAGVARGYLERPELTAARFVDGPNGERLYRTGDIVRSTPAGDLRFVGRVDHQVKIRGHRIELGEIEAKLSAIRGVSECVVLCREDRTGDKRLVAYYVPTAGVELRASSLREQLARELPNYMNPRAYVRLERFPLSSNGKIDRAALPKPGKQHDDQQHSGRPPRRPVEKELARLWSSLLDVPTVGLDDDFFALGGHSLLATRLLARIRAAFAVELALPALFAMPTIEATAPLIEAVLYLRDAEPAMSDGDHEEFLI